MLWFQKISLPSCGAHVAVPVDMVEYLQGTFCCSNCNRCLPVGQMLAVPVVLICCRWGRCGCSMELNTRCWSPSSRRALITESAGQDRFSAMAATFLCPGTFSARTVLVVQPMRRQIRSCAPSSISACSTLYVSVRGKLFAVLPALSTYQLLSSPLFRVPLLKTLKW